MCGGSREGVLSRRDVHPHLYSLPFASLIRKWILLHLRDLAVTSDPREGAVMGRNASSLTISVQRPGRGLRPNHHYHPYPPLPLPKPGREGVMTPRQETFAISIGIIVGPVAHLDAGVPPPAPPLPVELAMKTLRMQLWKFSR